jgi:hypothetical protein
MLPMRGLPAALCIVCMTLGAAAGEAFRVVGRSPLDLGEPDAKAAGVTGVQLAAAPDEFETAAFALCALQPLRNIRVTLADLKGPGGAVIAKEALSVRRVLPAKVKPRKPEGARERSIPEWVLPADEAAQPIADHESATFWITVHVPAEASAGRYAGEVLIEAQDAAPAKLTLEVSVRGFKLEPPPVTFAMLFTYEFRFLERYDPLSPKRRPENEREAFLERSKAIVRDLAEHGMNAIWPHGSMGGPAAVLRKDGKPFLPDLEMSLRTAKACGMNRTPGWFVGRLVNAQYQDTKNFDAQRDGELLRELCQRAAEIARAEGFQQIIVVPADEPDDPDNRKLPVAQQLLQAGKGIEGVRFGVTSGGNRRDSLRKLAELHQVSIFAGGTTAEERAEAKKSGHEVWLYENNATTGHNPLWSRYVFGYFGWRGEFDGISAWSYPLHTYAPYDERKRLDADGTTVPEFDRQGRPVNTVVWEAIREGVDDRRYLETLKAAIAGARQKGLTGPAEEAQKVLDEIATGVSVNFSDYGYVHNEYGEPLPGQRDAAWYAATREKLAAAITRLRGAR